MAAIQSINPATGALLAEYEPTPQGEIEKALAASRKCFEPWQSASFRERAAVLKAVAAQIRKDSRQLAELATREMGKPIQQSLDELAKCARTFDFYARHGAKMLADEIIETDARK